LLLMAVMMVVVVVVRKFEVTRGLSSIGVRRQGYIHFEQMFAFQRGRRCRRRSSCLFIMIWGWEDWDGSVVCCGRSVVFSIQFEHT